MKLRNIYIAITQGNVYRDIVRLGMIKHLVNAKPDIRVILMTQAYAVDEVLEEIQHERIIAARHDVFSPNLLTAAVVNYRKRRSSRLAINCLQRIETALVRPPAGLLELFKQYPPDLVVTTHPRICWEWDLIAYASKHKIKTAGIVKSWDNILRHLFTRTDSLAVWNKVNYREAKEVEKYRESEIRIIGAMAFDRYFTKGVIKPRDEFLKSIHLDPSKPVVFFGTAGSFSGDWDETFMMDLLLKMADQNPELRDVQIICRLHPISHLEYFWQYRTHPRVVLSFGSYVKTLGWCMTQDEVDEMANMLCHSDVLITPASTLSIEGPIFDLPTIVTLFSTVRPDLHQKATKKSWLDMHFKPIVDNDWLPLAYTPQDLLEMLLKALSDKSWYREGRKRLVEEYVTLTDGRSRERAVEFLDDASRGKLGVS